jgi:ribosome-associated protein
VDILEEKIGENILLLDIREVAVIADFFVICTGTSDRMLKALADAVLEAIQKDTHRKGRLEGEPSDGWILVDYGDVVVHLMSPERRNYYRLEDLWSNGKVVLRLQ